MTLTDWTSIGGWWASGIALLCLVLLRVNKPLDTEQDREDRRMMTYLTVMFGWIPLGALAIVVRDWLLG